MSLLKPPVEAFLRRLRQHHLNLDAVYQNEMLRVLVQSIMEIEVSRSIDAGRYERRDHRRAYRNGYRLMSWESPAGVIELRVPKLRKGTYYPHFIDSCAHLLHPFILEMFVLGVDSAALQTLWGKLRLAPLHDGELAEMIDALDSVLSQFRFSPLRRHYAELIFDVLEVEIERGGRLFPRKLAILLGIDPNGEKFLLDHGLALELEEDFWVDFLRRLESRGVESVTNINGESVLPLRTAFAETTIAVAWMMPRPLLLKDYLPEGAVSPIRRRADSPHGLLQFSVQALYRSRQAA